MATKYRRKYTIRNITPGTGYRGVWTHETDDGVQLEALPINFVGIADERVYRDCRWIEQGPDIVAIMLGDGFFDVVDGHDNFHGIVAAGTSWEECFDLVPRDRQRRLATQEVGHVG